METTAMQGKSHKTVDRLTKILVKHIKLKHHFDFPLQPLAPLSYSPLCRSSYVTKIFDFSQDEAALCRFVQSVSSTGGGDADECYELVLREARTKLAWRAGSTRYLLLLHLLLLLLPLPLQVPGHDW